MITPSKPKSAAGNPRRKDYSVGLGLRFGVDGEKGLEEFLTRRLKWLTTAFRLQRTGREGAETKQVQVTVKATKQWKSKLSGSKVMIKG